MCHFREAGGAKNGRLFGRKNKFDGSALLGYPENGRGRAAAGLRGPFVGPVFWAIFGHLLAGGLRSGPTFFPKIIQIRSKFGQI